MGVALFILILLDLCKTSVNLSTAQSQCNRQKLGKKGFRRQPKKISYCNFDDRTHLCFLVVCCYCCNFAGKSISLFFRDFVSAFSQASFCHHVGGLRLLGFYPAKISSYFTVLCEFEGESLESAQRRWKINLKALYFWIYTVSLNFIIAAMVVGRQINFMKYTDKVFNTKM